MKFVKKTLDNGLNIIAEINENAQSAAVGFFAKTGARDETMQINGVSHFLEHMMFKGTDKLSWMDVNETFDRTGAQFNAFTSEENTVYYAAVLPEYLEQVTELWVELMRPSLKNDDFNMEKNVIKEEIAMYQDMPQFEIFELARELHFGDHPCGQSVLGTNESIDNLKAEQMKTYFTSRYSPNNITVVFSGKLDFDKMCKLIQAKAAAWKPQDAPRNTPYFEGTFKSKVITRPNLACQHICLISPSVSMQDEDKYAASVLSSIIGDSTGSRFYWALVDTALAEEASMHLEAMDGIGANFSYIKTTNEHADKVMQIAKDIFTETTDKGVTEAELEAARNKILSSITIKNEVPMGRLVEIGINWVYLNKYITIDETVEKIKSIKLKDVNDLLAKYKLTDHTTMVIKPQ